MSEFRVSLGGITLILAKALLLKRLLHTFQGEPSYLEHTLVKKKRFLWSDTK